MLNINFEKMCQLYLYQEIDNWEWTYNDLVDLLTDEFNYSEAKDILVECDSVLTDEQALIEFKKSVEKEIKKYYSLDTVATDDKNNVIMESLKVELSDILS